MKNDTWDEEVLVKGGAHSIWIGVGCVLYKSIIAVH